MLSVAMKVIDRSSILKHKVVDQVRRVLVSYCDWTRIDSL
jgi:hypothetical protein